MPRHVFVPSAVQEFAYEDTALPIACEQTISQPFIVSTMAQAIGSAVSSYANSCTADGTKTWRGTRRLAASTRGSQIPRARSCRSTMAWRRAIEHSSPAGDGECARCAVASCLSGGKSCLDRPISRLRAHGRARSLATPPD